MDKQQTNPRKIASIASVQPVDEIQRIFSRNEVILPQYTISFLNGEKHSLEILKHCFPIGIPTIVTHQNKPDNNHSPPVIAPPLRNQIKFPNTMNLPLKNRPAEHLAFSRSAYTRLAIFSLRNDVFEAVRKNRVEIFLFLQFGIRA